MKQYFNIGKEPNLQKIVIASAVLHILFIALVVVPLRTKERDINGYIVNLVSPTEIQRTPEDILPEESLKREKEIIKKAELKKENPKDKTQLNKVKYDEQSSPKKTYGNEKNLSTKLLWQIENSKILSKKESEISRDFHAPEGKYHRDPVPNNVYREPALSSKEDFQKQQSMITRKNTAGQKETMPGDLKSDLQGNPDIDFNRNAQGVSLERRGVSKIIEKPNSSDKSEDINAYSRGEGRSSDDDKLFNSEISTHGGSSAGRGGSTIIVKRGLSGGTGDVGTVYNRQGGAQGASNADPGGEGTGSDNYKLLTSEISIKGVPLHDLNACTNALDEGILKKNILNIIGNKKACISQATGKYIFFGTDRYTSFEMTIFPVPGRKPSNQCEELKNALFCLKSIKE